MKPSIRLLVLLSLLSKLVSGATCISGGNETVINNLFQTGGVGKVVQICPSTTITIYNPIVFAADGQELSASGYPTGSTRATILLAASPSNTVSTLVYGQNLNFVKLKNIVIGGNRPNAGYQNGGANIELGQASNGVTVSYVASRNCRAWSCMHIAESGSSGSPCQNVTITNNDIGPCGADTNGNVIKSSSTYVGFGAINMVDYLSVYSGSFAGVSVTNNVIQGAKLFKIGIAIGANVWGEDSGGGTLHGPATVSSNTFSGNITFPMVVNGWDNGINATGNSVSAVVKPNSAFADQNNCHSSTQAVFNSNAALSYYAPLVQGAATLPGFVNASAGEPTAFLCVTPTLPSVVSYAPGGWGWQASGNAFLADLHNGIRMQFQGGSDANLVILNTTNNGAVQWASGHTASCGSSSTQSCDLSWQSDGNLVSYSQGYANVLWTSGTNPNGTSLVAKNVAPWIQILDKNKKVLWDTSKLQ